MLCTTSNLSIQHVARPMLHLGLHALLSRSNVLCVLSAGGRMTIPCEGQLLLLTPPFEDNPLEPIVLGSVPAYPGLVDEYGTQVCTQA